MRKDGQGIKAFMEQIIFRQEAQDKAGNQANISPRPPKDYAEGLNETLI